MKRAHTHTHTHTHIYIYIAHRRKNIGNSFTKLNGDEFCKLIYNIFEEP